MVRRERGYSLMEVVIAMAVFGVFLLMLTVLTAEMSRYEKKLPINFMKHPQLSAIVSRLRKDVLDADPGKLPSPYLDIWPEDNPQYANGKQVLIVRTIEEDGRKVVVWDFREKGVVIRRSYGVGAPKEWIARGLPPAVELAIDAEKIPGRYYAVRFKAVDEKGRIAIDQILQPRTYR